MSAISPLKQRLIEAIRGDLSSPTNQDVDAYVDYWHETKSLFTRLYRDTASLGRWLFGKSAATSLPEFIPADVLKAELFADSTGTQLRKCIDMEVDRLCSKLAADVVDRLLPALADAGRVYRVQRFGKSTVRLTLKRSSGNIECDLICERLPKPNRTQRRIARRSPGFLGGLMVAYSGRCIRVVDEQQNVQSVPNHTIHFVRLGDFAINVQPTPFPPEPRSLPSRIPAMRSPVGPLLLPDVRTVLSTIACLVPVSLVCYGTIYKAPVALLSGAFLLMTVFFYFLKQAGNATNP